MFDEQAFIARVEAADADELAEILRRPTKEEDRVLRAYLGEARYRRQRDLTLHQSMTRGTRREPAGNVVVIHGIMGSELSAFNRSGAGSHIWVKVFQIMSGALVRLQLAEDGLNDLDDDVDVRATGILKRHYGDLLLSLSATWRVRAYWFDWRKDLTIAARELDEKIQSWFAAGEPVHIVAHSLGGLVARTFVHNHGERWKAMRGKNGDGGRLVMLGTPNHGSFVIPQVIAGIESTAKKIALIDLRHSPRELQSVFNSFVGLYQMLPSPLVADGRWKDFYEAERYGDLRVRQEHLDTARAHHELLAKAVDPKRMVYVAGADQPTLNGLKDIAKIADLGAYDVTRNGDGRVPHELGLLDGVPTYYVKETHGDLTVNRTILDELDNLLQTGGCGLPTEPPAGHRGRGEDDRALAAAIARDQAEQENRVRDLASALGARAVDDDPALRTYGGFKERELEEAVVSGFLSSPAEALRPRAVVPSGAATLRVALTHGFIEQAGKARADLPIDAIAVGHYLGVKPQQAELALDKALSAALAADEAGDEANGSRLVLTQFVERGIIRGELGQPFFLADPRDPTGGRVVVIAGMGIPGRFGTPELTVLAREVFWSLARLRKRHLATVLIGGGTGNLPTRHALTAWLTGARDALTGSTEDLTQHLERVTFVEASAPRVRELQAAIVDFKADLERRGDPFRIEYDEMSEETLAKLEAKERERDLAEFKRRLASRGSMLEETSQQIPTRVTLSLEGETYRFGAITEGASLPERSIALDPRLVNQANDELAAEWKTQLQQERGQLLERLLVPADLRPHLTGDSPLVMLLDSTTARIHWEMLAQEDPGASGPPVADDDGTDEDGAARQAVFLGTRRGLTRQLRTTFAPPPEAPPPPRRVLNVLVVADPAEDAPLKGAQEEGVAVADLFESFNTLAADETDSRVRVVRLFGPNDATRTHVLRHLICRSYDLLHFAGHCVYEEGNPARQGWLFNRENVELLSPNELNRIDRIPKFVFSNACESGITPDRSGDRAAGLAPSFAESFFARGVSNFVCTAWPVNDVAAREFAVTLYAQLLGLERVDGPTPTFRKQEVWTPEPMHEAMRAARLKIVDTLDGAQTWGAYQHYGNPYFRLFEPRPVEPRRREAPAPPVETSVEPDVPVAVGAAADHAQ